MAQNSTKTDPGTAMKRTLAAFGGAGTRLAAAAADVIAPPVCLHCHQPAASHGALCAPCWSTIRFIRPPVCDRLGIPLPYDIGGPALSAEAVADPPVFDRARSVAHHTGAVRELVHDLKFRDRDDVVDLLANWMADAGRDLIAVAEVIVPVPLGRWRLLRRTFNQSALLAQALARRAGMTYDPLSLVRTRATASQVGLTRLQREDNVRGAFAVPEKRRSRIDGKSVLLIDDVMTTGATVSACTRALRNAGAERVDVLTVAVVTGDTNLLT